MGAIEIEAAIEAAAQARAESERAHLRALHAIASAALAPSNVTVAEIRFLKRAELGRALNISVATLDRMRREPGFPQEVAGAHARFDLTAVRSWLRARPARPSTSSRRSESADPIDISTALRRGGLRAVGGK